MADDKKPDLTKLTATEYLSLVADLYKMETWSPQGGSRGGVESYDPLANTGSIAFQPRKEESPLPTFSLGAGPGSLGFSAETNLPGGRLLAARKYSRPPESSGSTVQNTLEAARGPFHGFYSETSQPGGDTTKYGGEADLGPFNILGEWYTDSPTGAPSVSGGTAGVSGQTSLFDGIVSGELKKSFGPGAGHSARLGWTGGLGSLPGNLRVGADYYDREGGKPFVGADLSYGLEF